MHLRSAPGGADGPFLYAPLGRGGDSAPLRPGHRSAGPALFRWRAGIWWRTGTVDRHVSGTVQAGTSCASRGGNPPRRSELETPYEPAAIRARQLQRPRPLLRDGHTGLEAGKCTEHERFRPLSLLPGSSSGRNRRHPPHPGLRRRGDADHLIHELGASLGGGPASPRLWTGFRPFHRPRCLGAFPRKFILHAPLKRRSCSFPTLCPSLGSSSSCWSCKAFPSSSIGMWAPASRKSSAYLDLASRRSGPCSLSSSCPFPRPSRSRGPRAWEWSAIFSSGSDTPGWESCSCFWRGRLPPIFWGCWRECWA